jgi:hypothetical protein
MKDRGTLAAVGGFAFVAAWIGFSFGEALLCLLGAAVAWTALAIVDGRINLADLQARLQNEDDAPPPPAAVPPPPPAPVPPPVRPVRRPGRPRVQ